MRNPLEFSLEEIEKFKVSNIIKYYNFKNAEDFYLQYYKTEAPKCLYCDNKAKFKSFKEGYFYSCNYNKHKNELSFLSIEKLIEYSEKYDENTLKDFCIGNAIIINDTLLTRKQNNYNFSYLRNNIILDEMLEKCKNCNEEYIKYDFVYDEKEQKMIKIKIGADFSCGKLECYRNCVTFYNHSEESKIKQSKTMKSKIKNGDFTPQITNSWTHHNNKFVYNHINFRSSWELLFYLLNYKKK